MVLKATRKGLENTLDPTSLKASSFVLTLYSVKRNVFRRFVEIWDRMS